MYKDDAISREYCLDTIAKLPLNWEYGLGVEDCYKIVENAPSIDGQVCKWISVEDRLPEPSTYVLALTAPGALSVGQNVIVADYIHPKSEDHGVFVIAYTNYDDKDIVPVTHWMPLPDMTKEDEQHE